MISKFLIVENKSTFNSQYVEERIFILELEFEPMRLISFFLDWLNFDFALLREVTRCLGAAENLEQQSILHRSRDILKHRGPLRLREYDVKTIQVLYR